MTAVSYTLLIDGAPAGPELLGAIQQIEVEDHVEMADMLRLSLAIGVRDDGDWTVLHEEPFARLTHLSLLLTVGRSTAEPLIDGYVIETSATFATRPGQSTLNVVAMDATALMNLEEKVRPWPNMADSAIAAAIFGEYGFTPEVEATEPVRQELDYITMQRDTDIRFLRGLAARNGYECYVESNPRSRVIEGHFHPPRLDRAPQGVLSVNMGEMTNMQTFNARYAMLRPVTARVTGLEVASRTNQPAEATSLSLPALGRSPTLPSEQPRQALLAYTGLSETGELQTYTQALVDRSGWAITAEGEVDTVAYAAVLHAKRPVLVRGAGRQFSGLYYVERVMHSLGASSYSQRVTLRRNALGLTGGESFAATGAIAGLPS